MTDLKRKIITQPWLHTKEWADKQHIIYPNNVLSEKARSFLTYTTPEKPYPNDLNLDLVYILKASESNPDIRISLRSVAKFCNFRRIWIVGYKPSWIKGVRYIPTIQNQDKWKNSIINYMAACNCEEVSENFILMNDDFFALKPIYNWRENLNVCLGKLSDEVRKNANNPKKSRWKYGFDYAVDTLKELKCETEFNYETHLPIIINKANFKQMMKLPIIKDFMVTRKVLHKRSIYKNLYPDSVLTNPRKIDDVKITLNQDLSDVWLREDWLSVFDDTVGNTRQYPKLNQFLSSLFSEKCKFEV